jgi:hypothetical protein
VTEVQTEAEVKIPLKTQEQTVELDEEMFGVAEWVKRQLNETAPRRSEAAGLWQVR